MPRNEKSPMSVMTGNAVVFFIIKRDLESISQTTAAASQIPEFNMESEEQRPRREEPSTNRTYPKICIFYQKTTAYKKIQAPAIL